MLVLETFKLKQIINVSKDTQCTLFEHFHGHESGLWEDASHKEHSFHYFFGGNDASCSER